MRTLQQTITSDPSHLASVRHAVETFCAECGYAKAACDEIGLCVNEAMANIIRHAYAGKTDRPIELKVTFADDIVQISLRDWGTGKDPSNCKSTRDPLQPGGLGMLCLRKMMDEVRFTPQPDGMLLTMSRRRNEERRMQSEGCNEKDRCV
jgi:serine/threonine-protein kinase RsbW